MALPGEELHEPHRATHASPPWRPASTSNRQLDALKRRGPRTRLKDRASGADPDRQKLACLDHLRTGDVLVVLDLDRLGRRAAELIFLTDDLESRDIGFKALNSPMDTTTPAGRAFLQIQAALAGDGAQHHPPARPRRREGGWRRGPEGRQAPSMTVDKLR